MLRILTRAEARAWNRRVALLYRSRRIEDQIVAILMDTSVGGSGVNPDSAKAKAEAIVKHLAEKGRSDEWRASWPTRISRAKSSTRLHRAADARIMHTGRTLFPRSR